MTLDTMEDEILERLTGLSLCSEPWDHFESAEFLPASVARSLAAAFNAVQLTRQEKEQENKPYKLSNKLLPPHFDAPLHAWQRIANLLQGAKYRASLERLTGEVLQNRPVTLNMWTYGPGDLLGPHQDHPNKIVTQIFYLTAGWTPGDGGRLALLADRSMDSVIRYVPPFYGSTFIFVRSERSWHAVEPVARNGAVRQSMTLTYWREL